jgi:hypothetical protein
VAVIIAVINLILCVGMSLRAFVQRRLLVLPWALVAYFSILLVPMAYGGGYRKYRGFSGDFVSVSSETVLAVCTYVLAFNLLVFIGAEVVWRLLGGRRIEFSWTIKKANFQLAVVEFLLALCLLVGGGLFWVKMGALGYREYVEFKFQGANWPLVFLWASAPLTSMLAMQRRYGWALVACMPFLYFAYHLNVRSFALLSLIPVASVFYIQRSGAERKLAGRSRSIVIGGMVFLGLVLISSAISVKKTGHGSALPDSGLVYGVGLVFEAHEHGEGDQGFNSLRKYALNLGSPFLKLAGKLTGYHEPQIEDTPVYIARLIDGVPKNHGVYYHYPALWYSDAYVSFGNFGLLLGLLWGGVLAVIERAVARRSLLAALVLPFYTWHAYMLVRGAVAIATVPISYAFYVALLIFSIALWPLHGRASSKYRRRVELDSNPLNRKSETRE